MTDTTGQEPPPEKRLDLTTIGSSAAQEAVWEPGSGLKEEKYDPAKARESVRGQIAMWLVWSFVGFIALAGLIGLGTQIGCAWATTPCDAATTELKPIRALVELILTPLVGLVGAVSGFYFGEKSANSNSTS